VCRCIENPTRERQPIEIGARNPEKNYRARSRQPPFASRQPKIRRRRLPKTKNRRCQEEERESSATEGAIKSQLGSICRCKNDSDWCYKAKLFPHPYPHLAPSTVPFSILAMQSSPIRLATYFPRTPVTWLTLCAMTATSPAFAQSAPARDAVATIIGSIGGNDDQTASDDSDLSPQSPPDDAEAAAPTTITAFGASTTPMGGRSFTFTLARGTGALGALAPPKLPLGAPVTAGENAAAAAAAASPSTDDSAGLRTAGYVAGGVGLVGLALFAIAGLGAKRAYDKLEADCGHTPCTDEAHRSDIEGGRMMQTAANIGLATGLVGLGVGATLLVLGNQSSSDKRGTSATVSANGGMITYGGHF